MLGAAGFIGAAIVSALEGAGHQVRRVVRGAPKVHLQAADADVCTMRLDQPASADADSWIPLLNGVDGVVNAAGVLQPIVEAHAWAVHRDAPDALYRACERIGVRRVIHVSAAGIDDSETLYARSKRAGEAALVARDLDWTVVRPVVVVGDGSYGGTSLLRALSAFPYAIPLVGRSDAPCGVAPGELRALWQWMVPFILPQCPEAHG